jgi:NAD(P)-dependent dehydrogenase (short-subunit alcohol dehydrogenase family)
MATIEFPQGQVALVTGAAGGIGSATVRRYAEEGVGCALVDIHNGVVGTAEKFASEFPNLTFQGYVADLTNEAQVADLVATVDRDFNRLDHLAAVAGVLQDASPVESMALEEWNRVLSVNVTSLFLITKHSIPLLRRDGGGTITNIASFWGRSGRAYFAAYCTSKAAVFVLTQSLAAELAPDVRVNAIAPGNINTSMHQRALHREAEERGVTFEEIRDKEWGEIPLKVAGEPSVIADSVVFLSSPAASYITGASLDVNGGVLFH